MKLATLGLLGSLLTYPALARPDSTAPTPPQTTPAIAGEANPQPLLEDPAALRQAIRELLAQVDAYEAKVKDLQDRLAAEQAASEARDGGWTACRADLASQREQTRVALELVDRLAVIRGEERKAGFWRSVRAGMKAGMVGFGSGYVTCEALNR